MTRTLDYESAGAARPRRPRRSIWPVVEGVLVAIIMLAMYGLLVLVCYVGIYGVDW